MTLQQVNSMSPTIPVLASTLQEILDILYRKYPEQVALVCSGDGAPEPGRFADFEDLIVRHSDDKEIQEILIRRFRECATIIASISRTNLPAAGQRFDLYSEIDEESSHILRALYERRYATLDELSVCSGLTHYDVLHRLRDIIIPMSVKRRGRPIAVFLESATDLITGRQIAFSWWWNNELPHKKDAVEVVETSDSLVITLDRAGYDLPKTMSVSATCTHGILEICVEKKQRGGLT
jgi:hypothetical protein